MLIAACSGEAPLPRQPAPAPPPSATTSEAAKPAPPAPPAAGLPADVPAAAQPVCTYNASAGDVSAIDLFVPGSDTRWATVIGGSIRAALPKTTDGQPVLTIEHPRARVRAEGRLASLPLELARPKIFGGIFAPRADGITVASVSASGPSVVVHKLPHLTSTALVDDGASCDDLVLGRTNFSADAVVPDTSSAKRALLVTGITIPVRATEDGAPMGELSFPKTKAGHIDEAPRVSVVATSKGSSRVVLRELWGTVFGWVPSSALTPTRPSKPSPLREAAEFGMIGLLAGAEPRGATAPPPPRDRVTCLRDVPLIVEIGGRETTVGAILAGATMEVGVERGPTTRLFSAPPGLNPMDEARLFVWAPALAGCERERVADPRVPPDTDPE